jgi:cytochrome b561
MQYLIDYIAEHSHEFYVGDIVVITILGILLLFFANRLANFNMNRFRDGRDEEKLKEIYNTHFWLGILLGSFLVILGAWKLFCLTR